MIDSESVLTNRCNDLIETLDAFYLGTFEGDGGEIKEKGPVNESKISSSNSEFILNPNTIHHELNDVSHNSSDVKSKHFARRYLGDRLVADLGTSGGNGTMAMISPNKMANCLGKFVGVILLIVSLAQCRGPHIQHTPAPIPFFPRYSLVADYYGGEVSALTDRLLLSELSLVLYYAPWDRESQECRSEFEKVARYHHEQVYFAAINCWYPDSECRVRYKIRSFPAIILHVRVSMTETKVLAYNGPRQASHLIRFVSRALRPLVHVTSQADLIQLRRDYGSVALGYYNFASSHPRSPMGFAAYHTASLRLLQHDYGHALGWGIVTNPHVAGQLALQNSGSVYLVLWNVTLLYTKSQTAKSEAIASWVLRHHDDVTAWVALPGVKSLALNNLLQTGPLLMLFTPNNPFMDVNEPYNALREVALQYNNCNESSHLSQLAHHLGASWSENRARLRQKEKRCFEYMESHLELKTRLQHLSQEDQCKNDSEDDCSSNVWPDLQTCPMISLQNGKKKWSIIHYIQNLFTFLKEAPSLELALPDPWGPGEREYYSGNATARVGVSGAEVAFDGGKLGQLEMGQVDDRVGQLMALDAKDECRRLWHSSLVSPHPLVKENKRLSEQLTGMSCRTNRSLSFVAVDSLSQIHLAKNLGIEFSRTEPHRTVALIIDSATEVHFTMDVSLSKRTLADFVINFTRGGFLDRQIVSTKSHSVCSADNICIAELSSNEYSSATQQPGQTVVVLHYSHGCASCAMAGLTILGVANVFQRVSGISFARVEVSGNTLPWSVNFALLPVVILYPADRKGESHIFDQSSPLTIPSLMTFILNHMPLAQRQVAAIELCGQECSISVSQLTPILAERLRRELVLNMQHLSMVTVKQFLTLISTSTNLFSQSDFFNQLHVIKEQLWLETGLVHERLKLLLQTSEKVSLNAKKL